MWRSLCGGSRQIGLGPRAAALCVAHRRRALATSSLSSSCSSSGYRIAVVGSGPSGCYAAKYLRAGLEKHGVPVAVRVLERLPAPFGLVRYGVAPDHPEVKNVEHDFCRLFEDGGGGGSITYRGNVRVGADVAVDELRRTHDAVVLAYGCASDRRLGVPGEGALRGVLSAREFVAWYNGHPDFVHIGAEVDRALGAAAADGVRQASVAVVGQGNVALDCARVLAKGAAALFDTDLAAHALSVLGARGVAEVAVLGRRGHVQGAFTIKELRELVRLEEEGHGAAFAVRSSELDRGATEASRQELESVAGRPKKRIDKLLREAADREPRADSSKVVRLRFLLSPQAFLPQESDPTSLGAVLCERTVLQGEPGRQVAVGTGELETLPATLALVSIGYKGVALPGTEAWFDERRGTLVHEAGRVDPPTDELGGLYAAGWLKRGPSGIIGTNINDAKETVATILHDLDNGNRTPLSNPMELDQLLKDKGVSAIDWEGVRRIYEYEYASRRSEAQPREKMTDVQKQIEVALKR